MRPSFLRGSARLVAALSLLALAGLAGCGKSSSAATSPGATAAVGGTGPLAGAAPPPQPMPAKGASAEEVARAARDGLHCPATTATPARAATAPVDDVQGVRLGLTYEEAWNGVLCTNDLLVATATNEIGFRLETHGQTVRQGFEAARAQPRVVRTGQEVVREMQAEAMRRGLDTRRETVPAGTASWFVGTMGAPGQERVLRVNREEHFADDATPTSDSLRAALRKKYGPTTREQENGDGTVAMTWAYDPAGHLQAEDAPLGRRCHGVSSVSMLANASPDCGLVVEAVLLAKRSNPALTERLQLGLFDEAAAWRMLESTEQALEATDRQRREHEVGEAAKKGSGTSL